MLVDREKIGELLAKLEARDIMHKGLGPEMHLGCFHSLNSENLDTCLNCGNYEHTCSTYLRGFIRNQSETEKHKQEIYESMNGRSSAT